MTKSTGSPLPRTLTPRPTLTLTVTVTLTLYSSQGDDANLGGEALLNCVSEGAGEPPQALLLAAVACAATVWVRGVPVHQLREEDEIGVLNLDEGGKPAIKCDSVSAALLGLLLPAAPSVHTLRCVRCRDLTL